MALHPLCGRERDWGCAVVRGVLLGGGLVWMDWHACWAAHCCCSLQYHLPCAGRFVLAGYIGVGWDCLLRMQHSHRAEVTDCEFEEDWIRGWLRRDCRLGSPACNTTIGLGGSGFWSLDGEQSNAAACCVRPRCAYQVGWTLAQGCQGCLSLVLGRLLACLTFCGCRGVVRQCHLVSPPVWAHPTGLLGLWVG